MIEKLLLVSMLFLWIIAQAEKMIDDATKPFWQYGAVGGMVVLCIIYIIYLTRAAAKERREMRVEHARERKEWKADADLNREVMKDIINKNTESHVEVAKSIIGLTGVMGEVRTLVESIERRT